MSRSSSTSSNTMAIGAAVVIVAVGGGVLAYLRFSSSSSSPKTSLNVSPDPNVASADPPTAAAATTGKGGAAPEVDLQASASSLRGMPDNFYSSGVFEEAGLRALAADHENNRVQKPSFGASDREHHPEVYNTFDELCGEEESQLVSVMTQLLEATHTPSNGGDDDNGEVGSHTVEGKLFSSTLSWFGDVLGEAMTLRAQQFAKVFAQEEQWQKNQHQARHQQQSPETVTEEVVEEEEAAAVSDAAGYAVGENLRLAESIVRGMTLSNLTPGSAKATAVHKELCSRICQMVSPLADLLQEDGSSGSSSNAVEELLFGESMPWTSWPRGVSFVVGKTLLVDDTVSVGIAPDVTRLAALALLLHSVSGSPAECEDIASSGKEEEYHWGSSLPKSAEEFYMAEAWVYLASALATVGQIEDALAARGSAIRLGAAVLDSFSRKGRLAPNLASAIAAMSPSSVAGYDVVEAECYKNALVVSKGNHPTSWHELSCKLALGSLPTSDDSDGEDGVNFNGKLFSEVDCYCECIRSSGGVDGTDGSHPQCGEAWLNLGLTLQGSSTVVIPRGRVPFTLFQKVVREGASPRQLTRVGLSVVAISRKTALAKSLSSVTARESPEMWIELGKCLAIQFSTMMNEIPTPDGKMRRILLQRAVEERVTIDDPGVIESSSNNSSSDPPSSYSRVACFLVAIAMDPRNYDAWYRLALSMEDWAIVRDRARKEMQQCGADDLAMDHTVFRRQVPIGPEGTVMLTRIDALIQCTKIQPSNPKAWFALGTTLEERNGVIAAARARDSPTASRVLGLPVEGDDVTAAPTEGSGPTGADVAGIDSEMAFKQVVELNPAYAALIEDWRRRRESEE